MSREKRTYIDPATGKWVTEDFGRKREATQEEIEETLKQWEKDQNG